MGIVAWMNPLEFENDAFGVLRNDRRYVDAASPVRVPPQEEADPENGKQDVL